MSQEIYYPQTENPELEAEELTRSLPAKCDRTILFNVPRFGFDNYLDSIYPYPSTPSYSAAEREARKSIRLSNWQRFKLFIRSAFSDEANAQREKNLSQVDSIAEKIYGRKLALYESERKNTIVLRNEYHDRFIAGEDDPVMSYFQYVLDHDLFQLENYYPYQGNAEVIGYIKDERKLSIAYRIPCSDELCTIARYSYAKKDKVIKEVQLPKGEATRYRLNTARYLLLRAALLLKEANGEKLIRTIDIQGFMAVQNSPKTVIRVTVPIRLLESRNPDTFAIEDLFCNVLKAKESYALYSTYDYVLTEA